MKNNEIKRILSEDPNADIWQMILHFTYPNNIQKYYSKLNQHGKRGIEDIIVSSLLQSAEFFKISANVSLNVSPVILYYGAINLYNGILTLINGSEIPIETHGMKLFLPAEDQGRIGDVTLRIVNPYKGALNNFYKIIEKQIQPIESLSFTFSEILGSIPELKSDFENCYEDLLPSCVPVEKLMVDDKLIERIAKKELNRFKNYDLEVFSLIKDFKSNYLAPQDPNPDYYVLRRKINSSEIGLYNGFGQKYFQLGIRKANKVIHLPQTVLLLIGLFALSSLSRYHPKVWNPFITNDSTGERQIIDKFLNICRRNIPNLLLNLLNNEIMIFIKAIDELTVIKKNNEQEELKELIKREVKNILRHK